MTASILYWVSSWALLPIGILNKPSGPKVIKLLTCSTQLSTKFILLIDVKMPTIVGVLTFMSMMMPHLRDLKQATSSLFDVLAFMSS